MHFEYVEDKCCFSSVSFLKTKLHNCLNPHLQLTLAMYAHKFFTLDNFPSQVAYNSWSNIQLADGQCSMLELQVLGFAQSLEGAHASYNMAIWWSLSN
jgi:hypothetical protein